MLIQHGGRVLSKEGELIDLADSPLAGNVRLFGDDYDPEWEIDAGAITMLEKIGGAGRRGEAGAGRGRGGAGCMAWGAIGAAASGQKRAGRGAGKLSVHLAASLRTRCPTTRPLPPHTRASLWCFA